MKNLKGSILSQEDMKGELVDEGEELDYDEDTELTNERTPRTGKFTSERVSFFFLVVAFSLQFNKI